MSSDMIIVWIILFVLVTTFSYGAVRGAPWVPTRGIDVKRFIKLADIKPGQKVYDLGCGDGRLVVAAAKRGAQAVGYEIALLPYLAAKVRCLFSGQNKHCQILWKDFWLADLSSADVVYVFLTEKIYGKLRTKLEQELQSGTKVIVYAWPIKEWEAVEIDAMKGQLTLFVYEKTH